MTRDDAPNDRLTVRSAEHPALLRPWRRAVEAAHGFLAPDDVDSYERAVAFYRARG